MKIKRLLTNSQFTFENNSVDCLINEISKIIILIYLYELLHYFQLNEISIFFNYVIIFCCFLIVLNFYFEYYIFLNNFIFSIITIKLLRKFKKLK